MIDVLVFLFENYFDLSTHPSPDALVRKLSVAGFEPDEISQALDWLEELKASRPALFGDARGTTRVYTDDEQERIGCDGLDFILFLESAGVVTPPLRELILDRAMSMDDDRVSLEKLKIIVLMVLWSQEQDLEPLIVEELLNTPDTVLLH